MVNVVSKRCSHPGRNKQPTYGLAGSKTADFCSEHTKDGTVNPTSCRIFVGMGGSAGDTRGQGGSPVCRVIEGRKRKDCSPLPAQAGAYSTRMHNKRKSSAPTAVKIEEDVAMCDFPGPAKAVRRTTGGDKKRHRIGAAFKYRCW